MEQTKRIGIWVRVSTEYQVKDDSPEIHERRARHYAEAKGWEVIEVYRLEAVSGKTVMELPDTKRMLRDIRDKRITGLIFSKLARLARNTKELLEFSEIFRKENADLISLAENIDTSSPSGRLFFTIIAAMAEWEREEIASRVAASVPIRAKMGKPLGGAAPYGYKWLGDEHNKNKQLVIDDKEAPIRKLIHELFVEHKRKGYVGRILNERGYRTRNGSKFSDTTIGRLLQDPTAKGVRRANYTKSLGDNKAWEVKPESEWVVIPCPAIISVELWDDCLKILDVQERKNKRPAKKPVYLFTGLLHCDCGGKMLVPSGSKKYVCNTCKKTRIATEDVEEIYYGNLHAFLNTDEDIEKFLARADATIAAKEEQLERLMHEQRRIQTDMDKLIDLNLTGGLPKEGFKRRYSPLDEQLKQIEHTIPEMQAELDYLKVEYLNSSQVVEDAQTLYDTWPTFTPERKRKIVEDITERITIGVEEITIKFSLTPSFFRNPPDSQHIRRGS